MAKSSRRSRKEGNVLRPRWYKVINDLAGNKTRTVLIVLSIAVGLVAVGTILSAQTI